MWIKLTHQMSAIPLSVFWSQRLYCHFISALHTARVLSLGDERKGGRGRERERKKNILSWVQVAHYVAGLLEMNSEQLMPFGPILLINS